MDVRKSNPPIRRPQDVKYKLAMWKVNLVRRKPTPMRTNHEHVVRCETQRCVQGRHGVVAADLHDRHPQLVITHLIKTPGSCCERRRLAREAARMSVAVIRTLRQASRVLRSQCQQASLRTSKISFLLSTHSLIAGRVLFSSMSPLQWLQLRRLWHAGAAEAFVQFSRHSSLEVPTYLIV
jgi:hypothetical protein